MACLIKSALPFALFVSVALLAGCGGEKQSTTQQTATAPTISTTAAQNGAEVVKLASVTSGATIYYTIDGTTPTTSSIVYEAPFLVASDLTIKAIAVLSGDINSSVAIKTFLPSIASGTLVWSDEFTNSGSGNAQPNSSIWTYDAGSGNWGNSELEDYCAYGSTASPCDTSNPNVYVASGGGLKIVAEEPSSGVYTSARIKTEGLFSFQYGRLEARIKLPEGQGLWPAFWLLGSDYSAVSWPACGELDVMEHVDGSDPKSEGYDWVQGSIHGTSLDTGKQYTATGFSAADWHTYGMVWTKGKVQYYVDDPANIYATFTPSTQTGTWSFDSGPQFIIMNLAVGGNWPGSPDSSTTFPSTMQVQYVRIYSN